MKIQKMFEQPIDIADSIRSKTEKVYAEPDLGEASTLTDLAKAAREDKKSMLKWQIQFERYQDKVEKFEGQWRNAYSLIWDTYCAKDVQVAISKLPNFETEIRDDPLKLLEKVKELMHTHEKAKYPVLTMVEIMANFLKCCQWDKEPLLDYLSRFKSERDIVYRLWGKKFLDSFSENLPD